MSNINIARKLTFNKTICSEQLNLLSEQNEGIIIRFFSTLSSLGTFDEFNLNKLNKNDGVLICIMSPTCIRLFSSFISDF